MNELVISVAVFLLPGILAAAIADKVTSHSPRWGSFKYGMYSFVFGIICYIVLSFLIWVASYLQWFVNLVPLTTEGLSVWSFISDRSNNINLLEVLAATALSPLVAFSAAFAINHKLFNKMATKIRVSRKYGDENLYSFFLNSGDIDWVYVRDQKKGITYEVRVLSFSENDKIQELVLVNAKVYNYEDSDELYSVPSIYLSNTNSSFTIESVPIEYLENSDEQKSSQ